MSLSKESPRLTAIPAKRSNSAALKVRLALLFGLVGLSALLGLVSTVAWFSSRSEPVNTATLTNDVQAKAQAEARNVAVEWLNGLPISVGRAASVGSPKLSEAVSGAGEGSQGLEYTELSWGGFTPSTLGDGARYEIHHFLVTSPGPEGSIEPVLYSLDVTMVLTSGSPVLGAAPALSPYRAGASGYNFDYSEVVDTVSVSSATQTVLEQWATAYATNDTQQLALIVSDPDNGTYEGVTGFTGGTLTVVNAIDYGSDNILVRARVSLTSANGFVATADYDLLVTQAGGSPHVVAWGAAGEGNRSGFTPYSFNRVPAN